MLAAGAGSRFKEYGTIKPAIKINDVMMAELVTVKYGLAVSDVNLLTNMYAPEELVVKEWNSKILLALLTRGPAESAQIALESLNIDLGRPVVFIDCDSFVDTDLQKLLTPLQEEQMDAGVVVFSNESSATHFSAVNVERDLVLSMKERVTYRPKYSSCGVYYFKTGYLALDAATKVVDLITDREIFMSDVINYIASHNFQVGIVEAPPGKFVCLGTPEELEHYVKG